VSRVTVLVLHADLGSAAEPLTRAVTLARRRLAEEHLVGFLAVGADDVELVGGPPDDTPFGTRLRQLVGPLDGRGLVLLGSGSLPLATAADRRAFVAVARSGRREALANDRFSADAVALGRADSLRDVPPDLATDNALPRWLAEVAGIPVADRRDRWRSLVDIDGPLDVLLVALAGGRAAAVLGGGDPELLDGPAAVALRGVATVMADPRAELLVAGRTSAATLTWLERRTACRVRALIEERGMKAALGGLGAVVTGAAPAPGAAVRIGPRSRPPVSTLGLLLDRDGPDAFGDLLSRLGDAAVVDTRVLLAHRLGPDERTWPSPEDRFASDLLLADRVTDPWLRSITASARGASIPVVLGGHTLVGPGLRLVARARRS
jgi:hypothetical protein